MALPITEVDTQPFCGACGWDAEAHDLGTDLVCDACGADLKAFGFTPPEPPVVITAPAQDATKSELLAWLAAQLVTGVDSLTKAELWDLINDLLD